MRRRLISMIMIFMLTASSAHGLTLLENIKYRKVQLPYQTTCLLVNRFTKKVEYVGEEKNWKKVSTLPKNTQKIYQNIADNASK